MGRLDRGLGKILCLMGMILWQGYAVAESAVNTNSQHGALKAESLAHPKVDSGLLSLLSNTPTHTAIARNKSALHRNTAGQVRIDVHTKGPVSAAQLKTLTATGLTIAIADLQGGNVEGFASPSQLAALANLDFVRFLRPPATARHRFGLQTTEGVAIHKADLLQAMGANGANVRVGVISDGVSGLAQSQKSGDLPANVTIVSNPCTPAQSGDCAEGTAMLEIVHHMAPGAVLGFCGGGDSQLSMQQCIDNLATSFQANIIVDDLGYGDEPLFEDSAMAKDINLKDSQGVLYVSAAGNGFGCFYEADYSPSSITDNTYDSVQDFGQAAGVASTTRNTVTVPAGGVIQVTLEWNDPFSSPSNDYDLFLDDLNGKVLSSSTNVQNGANGAPALEMINYKNTGTQAQTLALVVMRKKGSQTRRLKMTFSDGFSSCSGVSPIAYTTAPGGVTGHPAATGAIAVGAVDAATPTQIQLYSDHGPVRIDFPSLTYRNKPDIVAVDDVSISGAGGFGGRGNCSAGTTCFSGTSAAAPHVAALLALLKGNFSGDAKHALLSNAINLGDLNTFGSGRADVYAAAASLNQPPVASINTPALAVVGQALPLSATCTDPEGLSTGAYTWTSSNGTVTTVALATNASFTSAGTYTVNFSCNDAFGKTSNVAATTVTVTNGSTSGSGTGAGAGADNGKSGGGGGGAGGMALLLLCTGFGLWRRKLAPK